MSAERMRMVGVRCLEEGGCQPRRGNVPLVVDMVKR